MKIRNGFVSNSSSSSFILKLPFYPESYEDMKTMLLGDENPLVLTCFDNEGFPTKKIISIIHNDIIEEIGSVKKRPIQNIDLVEIEIDKYTIDEYDTDILIEYHTDYNKYKKEYLYYHDLLEKSYRIHTLTEDVKKRTIAAYYNHIDDIESKMRKIIIDSVKKKFLDTDIFLTLSYSDNDGSISSFIEHSEILNPITVFKISHH